MSKKKTKITIAEVIKTIILPRWKLVAIGLILIVLNKIAGLAMPAASKYLIDDVIANKDLELLKYLLAGVAAALLIQSITSYLLTLLLSVEAQHLISKLRVQVQKHILKLPVRFFDNTKSGTLVTRIMTDVEGVRNIVGTGLVQLFGGILSAVLSIYLMVQISWQLTVFVLIPVLIFGVISLKAFSYIRPIFRKRSEINAEVTGRLTESLNGIRVIKGFNAEDQEIGTFEKGVEQLYLNIRKSLTTTSFVTSTSTFLLGLATVGIMGISGYMIINDTLTIGDFLSFSLYLGFMIAPIIQMSNIGTQMTEAFAGLDRTQEIMNESTEEDHLADTQPFKSIKGDLEFHHVSFAYEQDKEVLSDISFTAKSGSVIALVGSSGSGKTTIAGLAASFLRPTAGKVTMDGMDVNTLSLNDYRSHLGVVLQDDFLFEGTIRENILFPRPEATEEQVIAAAKAANVDEFTNRFEDGLNTIIGERGVKLSGGQRQRIAIARAILADPKILLLDEATSNLDTESEGLIQESLANLMVGRTTIVIAHRLSTIRRADQILVIESGKIAEQGKHDELIEAKGRYYQLYTYQARI